MKKYEMSQIKDMTRGSSPNTIILDDEYINADSKLNCKCVNCGFEFKMSWRDIKTGKSCKKCRVKKDKVDRRDINEDEFTNKMMELNISFKKVDISKKITMTKLLCRCANCGNEWQTNKSNLEVFGCGNCKAISKRKSLDEVKIEVAKNTSYIDVVSGEYINNKTKFLVKCNICGKESSIMYITLVFVKNCKCRCCAHRIANSKSKLGIDYVKNYIIQNELDITLLSDEYDRNDRKLKFKCNKCNETYEKKFSALRSEHNCPLCSRKSPGVYSNTIAERNKDEFINKIAFVYVVKIYNLEEEFLKVGITTSDVTIRFSRLNKNTKYSFELLELYEFDLYCAIKKEQFIHSNFNEVKYVPLIKFAGHTECYVCDSLKKIKEVLRNDYNELL